MHTYITYITLHYVTLHYIVLHYITYIHFCHPSTLPHAPTTEWGEMNTYIHTYLQTSRQTRQTYIHFCPPPPPHTPPQGRWRGWIYIYIYIICIYHICFFAWNLWRASNVLLIVVAKMAMPFRLKSPYFGFVCVEKYTFLSSP